MFQIANSQQLLIGRKMLPWHFSKFLCRILLTILMYLSRTVLRLWKFRDYEVINLIEHC